MYHSKTNIWKIFCTHHQSWKGFLNKIPNVTILVVLLVQGLKNKTVQVQCKQYNVYMHNFVLFCDDFKMVKKWRIWKSKNGDLEFYVCVSVPRGKHIANSWGLLRNASFQECKCWFHFGTNILSQGALLTRFVWCRQACLLRHFIPVHVCSCCQLLKIIH